MSAKSFEKFGNNRFGICNSKGEIVSEDYLRKYIHCCCRVSAGYTLDRKSNIEYFMSDEFLSANSGKTACQIGIIASKSERWGKIEPVPFNGEYADFVSASLIDAQI